MLSRQAIVECQLACINILGCVHKQRLRISIVSDETVEFDH